MSENSGWKPNMDEISNETRSSQETICQNDNGDAQRNISASVLLFHHDATIQAEEEQSFKGEGMFVLQEDEISINATSSNALEVEPPMVMDEDTRMVFGNEPTMESPRDIISPGDPEDASSPFEAMESDVDSVQSASNIAYRRPLPPDNFHHMSTTTPGGSSDDEYSAGLNINARIKRRKKHVRNGDGLSYWNGEISARYNSPASSQIPSPSLSVTDHWAAETEDSSACPTPFLGKHNISYNNSDSNIHATINASRRHSNASEASLNTSSQSRDPISASVIKTEVTDTLTLTNSGPTRCRRLFKDQSQGVDIQNSEIVYKGPDSFTSNYPISQQNCTLEIVVQPESQHRARYLTEGSRGPVKDSSQQGFPQIKVKGYSGKATLHIFVVSENIDRLRPHGFYQACKVSGRNTSPCEEIDVDGTIVISMVVDTSEVISVDCVGILKLRNADVEARFGLQRAKKRSQNVRLVFRIFLHDLSTTNTINYSNPCVLQVVSNRINCTQPPGHPEIIKKSLDRGSVEGGAEMFIIGRNFRKGIKVIFQDPEEADGSHWSAIGQVDRNTFNQAHVVVEVPPYHDQKISKPVNVQVYIEYSRRKCDPHSFTYDPVIQKPVVTAAANPLPATVNNGNNPAVAVAAAASIAISNNGGSTSMNVAAAAASMNSESGDNFDCHMKKFLSSVADRKKLVAWFSELLMSADIDSAEGGGAPTKMQGISAKDEAAVFASMCPTAEVTDTKSEPPPVSLPNQPVAFTQAVPKTTPVEKPTPKVAAGVDVINSSFPSSSIVTSRPLAPSSFTNQFGVHSKLSTNNPISSNNAAFNPQSVFASNSAAASATIVAPKSESLFCFGSNQTQGSFPFSAVVSGGNNNGDNNNSSNTFSITTINNNTTTNVVNDIMDNNSQSAVSVSTSVASIIEQPSVSNSAVTSMITDDDVNSMSSWQPQSQSTINLSQAGINTASSTTSLVKASTLKPLFQTQISSNKMSTTADEVMTFINTTPTAAFDDTSQSAWTRQEQQQQQRQQHKQNDTDQQMMHVQNQTPQQNLNQNTQVFQQQPQQIQLGHIFQQSNVHQQQQQQQPQFVNSQQQGSQQQQQPTHLFKQQQQHQSFVTNQQQQTNNIQQQQTNNIQQQTNNIQQQQQTNNIQQQTNNIQQPNQQQQNVNQLQQQQFHQQQQAGGQFQQQQQQQQPTHMQQQHFQQQNPQQQQQRFQPQQTLVKPQTSQQQQQQNQVSQPQFTTITQLSTGGTGEMQVCGGQLPQIQQQQLSNLQQTQFLQQQQKPLQNNQQENNQQQQQFQQNHQQQQIGHNQQQQLILQQQQQLEDRLFQQQTSQHINIFGVTQKTTNSTGIPALSQSQVEQVLQQQQSFSSGPSAAQNQQQTVNSNIATTQQQQQNQQQSLMQQQTNNPITPSNQHQQQQQQQQQQQRNLMMNDVMQRFTQLEQQSPFNNQQQSTSSNHCNSSAIATATSNTPEFVPSPSQNTIMFPMNNNSSAGDSRLQKSHSNISLESGMSAQLNHNEDTSPSRLMESGLSIGFDNHFTIDDNPAASVVKCNNLENVISSSTIDSVIASDPELHSFISDCNRSAHESDNIAAFRDLAPNRSSPANPDSSLFTSGSTNNVTSSDSCFITSNDVEMMDKQYEVGQQQSKQQQSQQSFLSQNHEGFNTNQQQDHQLSAFISHQQVVDTDMYLVDPNVVVKQIHSKHSSVANSPINNNSVSVANSSSATVGGSSPFMPGNESNNTVQSRQATSSPMVGTEEMRLSHPHQQQSQNMNTSVADESNVGGGGTGNDMSSVQPMHLSPLSQAKSQQLNSSTAFETINPCGVLKLEDDTSPRDYPSVSIQQQQQQQQQQQLPSNS